MKFKSTFTIRGASTTKETASYVETLEAIIEYLDYGFEYMMTERDGGEFFLLADALNHKGEAA